VEVARGLVIEELSAGEYRGYAIPLNQHATAVKMLVERVFSPRDVDAATVTAAAELHDKYKPAKMRVERQGDRFVVGFRGHPYLLSFRDFEEVFGESGAEAKRKATIATGIARLHHFLNARDVDTFVHTLASVKAYLAQVGADAPLREIRRQVLEGVVLIHIADMVAGYLEQRLLGHASGRGWDIGMVDTDTLEHVEPHIPVALSLTPENSTLNVKVVVHGLEQAANPELYTGGIRVLLRYDVYEGVFRGKEFEGSLKRGYDVHLEVVHKQGLIRRVLARAAQQRR